LHPSLLQQTASTGLPFESSRRHFVLALRDDHDQDGHEDTSGADVANLKAPDGVNTIQLVSVLISLRFEALRLESGEANSANISRDLSATTVVISNSENQPRVNEIAVEDNSQDFEALLENDDYGPWNSYMDANLPSGMSIRNRQSNRRSRSAAILPLADIAMRSLICSGPIRPPAAIIPCEGNPLFNLANLAPAVFIPGYREAVQSRATFIPTIAKFLCQVLQHSESKIHPAHSSRAPNTSIIEPSIDEENMVQKDKLKQHLWMTLTSGVKNVNSPRKLKPLHIARTGKVPVSPCRTFEDIMNTWGPYEDYAMSPLVDGFEDLHLNEEQEFADTEDAYFSDLYDEFLSTSETIKGNVATAIGLHFDDEISKVISSSPSSEGVLNATLNSACSNLWPERSLACAQEATTGRLEGIASRGLRTILDSANSQLNEATESSILTCQSDMIGENGLSHDYVSRMLPSNTSEDEDSDSSRAETLLLEQFELRAFEAPSSISPVYKRTSPFETHDIIDANHHQTHKTLGISDCNIEMPSYEKNRSSLTDVIGGDHLLWQMWTKRRPSMVPTDDDMLEMHTMYAQDPDMRLLDTHKELDGNGEDYMLDSESSNTSSLNSASSTNTQQSFMFPYGPSPIAERKHHHPFHLHKDSPYPTSQSEAGRPNSRRKLSRGQSFLKRLSGTRASLEETSTLSRPFSRDEPRELEVKRRKTLADHDKASDSDDMLLR
jgi:hypothetical protein